MKHLHLRDGRRVARPLLAVSVTAGLLSAAAIATGITSAATAAPAPAAASVAPAAQPGGPHAATPGVSVDKVAKTVTMTGGGTSLVYDFDHGSVVTSFTLGGKQLLDQGMYSAITLDADGSSFDSRALEADPTVSVRGNVVTAAFTMGNDKLSLDETWRFEATADGVHLSVDRTYHWRDTGNTAVRHNGMLTIGWARVWDNIRRPEDGGRRHGGDRP